MLVKIDPTYLHIIPLLVIASTLVFDTFFSLAHNPSLFSFLTLCMFASILIHLWKRDLTISACYL